ncbi:mitochondrial translation initiation factor 2 [Oratosquilla oratoria]|uniref:mitochondrial translation initiation factor 2 n=1 Tax=Oratosquilla oratoria TaxID=337810 RepID=UPI003F77372D
MAATMRKLLNDFRGKWLNSVNIILQNATRSSQLRCMSSQKQHFANVSPLLYPLDSHPLSPLSFSTSQVLAKKRKGGEKRGPNNDKDLKEKPKIVTIWKNMTVQELADSIQRDIDELYEIFLYVENSEQYDGPDVLIDNLKVSQDAVKRAGLRFALRKSLPETRKEAKDVDVKRRPPSAPENMVKRPPVVTIMGHVDHGKTTLLDALRDTSVVDHEFGGITQHIGAFSVRLQVGEEITFLDTPGHAAFSAMRSRGATVTDMVVLVVAADDGVMQQTKESIQHALEANVPIIVAINKIDKPEADIPRTRQMLLNEGIQLEELGGEVQAVEISALKGTNLSSLVEALVTQSELLDLRGDTGGHVEGTVIESMTDPGRGKVSTCIVQRGTLRKGAVLVAGTAWCKVRNMFDEGGQVVRAAPPSTPIQIIGWRDLPSAGDEVLEVDSEKHAQQVVTWRKNQKLQEKQKEDEIVIQAKLEEHLKVYKAQLEERRKLGLRYKRRPKGPREKENRDIDKGTYVSIVLKADVDGSVEAILDVLDTYHSDECKLEVISYGVGAVTENDIVMAKSFDGSVYTFNVNTPEPIQKLARKEEVGIKENNIIYKLIDDLKEEISSKLPKKDVEEIIGEANVLEVFLISEGKKKHPVAGCRCVKGELKKDALYRVLRGHDIVYEGCLESMRHLKNEVNTIPKEKECGLMFEDPEIDFAPGDTIQCYRVDQEDQYTDWDPGF